MKLKNYKPLDTDKIMKQLHNGKVVSEKAVEPSLSQIPSVAHRRRQSMMDNTNYKFAYSRKKLICCSAYYKKEYIQILFLKIKVE